MVGEPGVVHRLGGGLCLLGRQAVAKRVPAVPAHRRRKRDRVAHREADDARGRAPCVRRRHLDVVVAGRRGRGAAQHAFRIKRHAVRQPLRRERHRPHARSRHAEDDRMARPHTPYVGAIDARFGLFRRREDAELRRQGRIVHRLDLRAVRAGETGLEPVGVGRIESRPLPAARRLQDDLLRPGEVYVHRDRLLAQLHVVRPPHDASVRPHFELRGRFAVALAGAGLLRVVVDRHERVKRDHLAVCTEKDRAFGMRTEAVHIRFAYDRQGISIHRLAHLRPFAAAARRPGEVERLDVRHAGARRPAETCQKRHQQRRLRPGLPFFLLDLLFHLLTFRFRPDVPLSANIISSFSSLLELFL